MDLKRWLKSRYYKTTPKHYLLSPAEMKQDEEIKHMFKNLSDNKGSKQHINLDEIAHLFETSGMRLKRDVVKQLFFAYFDTEYLKVNGV